MNTKKTRPPPKPPILGHPAQQLRQREMKNAARKSKEEADTGAGEPGPRICICRLMGFLTIQSLANHPTCPIPSRARKAGWLGKVGGV